MVEFGFATLHHRFAKKTKFHSNFDFPHHMFFSFKLSSDHVFPWPFGLRSYASIPRDEHKDKGVSGRNTQRS
jgi:hypothetical protein